MRYFRNRSLSEREKENRDTPKKKERQRKSLKVIRARENNLKNIDVTLPLGTFACVTGVSGSGKSSLCKRILYKRLANELNGAKKKQDA